MVNRRRGEVEAILDGRPRTLCLTLGALAELEQAFAAEDLSRLVERFATGRLSARDVARILAAGLTGGGTPTRLEDVFEMHVEGGVTGAAALVAELLAVTFGSAEAPPAGEGGRRPPDRMESSEGGRRPPDRMESSEGGPRPPDRMGSSEGGPRPPPVPGAGEAPSPGTT